MKIALGSDHGGFELKEAMKERLLQAGHQVEDFGCQNACPVDYPDKAEEVCRAVAAGQYELGILFCGTGVGMSIAANKVSGIRAALLGNVFAARMAREHNNANVLCLGGRVTGVELAWEMLSAYFGSSFSGGRHQTRNDKIQQIKP